MPKMSSASNTLLWFTLFASSMLPSVIGHGQVTRITVDGVDHDAWTVNAPQMDSAIRHVDNYEPMRGVNNPGINCGPGATRAAPLVADAKPGSEVSVRWNGADGKANWPHNTGPMLTYMASCGEDCSTFDSSKAKWFKIHEAGQKGGNGEWMQQDIMQGQDAVVPLPKNIKPGQYLFRHEIIALHIPGSAEFYGACAQLNIDGQGTGAPQPNELVSLPGAYKDTDAGISADVFTTKVYQLPGPKVAAFVNGNSPGTSTGNSTEGTGPQDDGSAQEPQGNNGQCHLYGKRSVNRPRAISRVMRNLRIH